ncbi:GIY-YIG nuclease family protein [Burkholderia metallica]|uniref:GIY-YIG nuclease family protein n=1 Tax=Burkholderia metallica TaxID=488729 RepID=UPI001CF54543|nr:GIY-YIG nuclease family protein [Burkholderia metallica]MCA7998517.1 GIY-YIG nuclease family protein [Burkholderia metallica]
MSWFLYLIECADDSVYTGITTDVAARFDEHASGKGARYTRSRKPRAVLASFPLPDRSSASRAEYWVKRLTPAQKRELAAGLRTLESVLPVVPIVVESEDAVEPKAGARGRKNAKNDHVDGAVKAVETRKRTQKAGQAEKVGKSAKGATPPGATKAAPAAKRTKATGDAAATQTSSRDTPARKTKPATPASSKRKAPVAGGKPVPNKREAAAPATRRRPPAARAADATAPAVAPPRRAKRSKDAPHTAAPPASVSAPVPTRAAARKQTPRTKQNRAAS